MLHLGRKGLHLARIELLLLLVEGIPGRDLIDPFGELSVLRDDAEFLLVIKDHLAGLVPAHVELAPVFLQVVVGRMVGRMHRARGPEHHEGQVGFDGLVTGDPMDGPVGQVLVQVVGLTIWLGGVVVPHHRDELVNIRSHEGVGMLKTFTTGPTIERSHLGDLVQRGVVPLAEGIVYIAGALQVIGHRLGGLGHDGVITWEPHGRERVAAEPDGVRVAAGHERRAGRGTQGCRVEIVVAQPTLGQAIDVGGFDETAEAADLGKAHVVQEKDDDVGCALGGLGRFGPPLLALFIALGNLALELRRSVRSNTA